MSKSDGNRIALMIAADVTAAGYELVRVQIVGGGKYATLQVMVERKDGKGITVDDCAKVSGIVSAIIEADPELTGRFDLEVSSPGVDRPLVKPQDYARFKGQVAKVETSSSIDGRRRFQGKIDNVSDCAVDLSLDKGTVTLPFEKIENAKLVLTDELLKAAQKRSC